MAQCFSMIIQSSYSVKLSQKVAKILYLYGAFNESFVYLAILVNRKEGVVHVDKDGNILYQLLFQKPMDTMAMINQKQAIFISTRQNFILNINLQTKEVTKFPHLFMNEQSDQTQLFSFSETKYLCIEEKGRYNDHRYKLTYFQYPLQLQDAKKTKNIACYQSKQNDWTYEHCTRKANNSSMMCWYKPRHDDAFQFKTYQLINGKGQFRVYKFNTSIAAQPHLIKVEVAIFNVWETKKDNFLFVCLTNKQTPNKNGGTVINSNLIIDVSTGKIRESAFTFGPYQDYLIDCYNLGAYSMFRTFKFEDNKIIKTPTYYVDNQTEKIVAQQIWQCSYLFKYQFPGFGSGDLFEGLYQNKDVDNFKFNHRRIVSQKVIFLHLMTEMVECKNDLANGLQEELMIDVLQVLGALDVAV